VMAEKLFCVCFLGLTCRHDLLERQQHVNNCVVCICAVLRLPLCEGCSNETNDIEHPEMAEGRHKRKAHQCCPKCQLISSA